jgi:YVTN family beta-propeller protein
VQAYDTKTRQLAGTIPVGASPHYALFTNDGRASLAVSQGPSELTVIDPSRRAISRVVRVGTTPHWVAASADGRTAFVANEMSNDISVVDIASGAVTATIPVGQAPRKIAAQPGAGAKAAATPATVAAAPGKMLRLGSATFADHGTHSVAGQKAFEIETDDYYFKPTFLRGAPGQRLTLEVENESGTLHNISIPDQKIDRDVPPKKTVKVDVVFPASGVITFACKFHTALGMNGQMLAGDAAPQPVVGASR